MSRPEEREITFDYPEPKTDKDISFDVKYPIHLTEEEWQRILSILSLVSDHINISVTRDSVANFRKRVRKRANERLIKIGKVNDEESTD